LVPPSVKIDEIPFLILPNLSSEKPIPILADLESQGMKEYYQKQKWYFGTRIAYNLYEESGLSFSQGQYW
jgi:hypothetical protein